MGAQLYLFNSNHNPMKRLLPHFTDGRTESRVSNIPKLRWDSDPEFILLTTCIRLKRIEKESQSGGAFKQ